jgi:4-hydroxybenzoate polyprenyltransferase
MNTAYRSLVTIFAVLFMGIGVALVVVTAVHGGGGFGYLMGALFFALGIGRLYLLHRRR